GSRKLREVHASKDCERDSDEGAGRALILLLSTSPFALREPLLSRVKPNRMAAIFKPGWSMISQSRVILISALCGLLAWTMAAQSPPPQVSVSPPDRAILITETTNSIFV